MTSKSEASDNKKLVTSLAT
uniref:Uncharacterized protein n=1 Tax=Arundo donax TaxID=35708 RepID=A0A0A9ADT9_ARUDO